VPRVLVAFVSPENVADAVSELVRDAQQGAHVAVHLAAVVEPACAGKVSLYVTRQRAETLARSTGRRWLEPLESILDAAGVPCTSEVILGRAPAVFHALAGRGDFDRVVLDPATVPGSRDARRKRARPRPRTANVA